MKTIGIIMTYNCAAWVEETYRKLPAGVFDEVIIVDDGSKDNTVEVAKKLNILVFEHPHLGYGGNLRYGLTKALERGADYMVEIHGDGQFDSSIAPKAIQKMQQDDLDFLIGSRFTKESQALKDGMPLPRYVANIALTAIEKVVLQIPWTEYHPGFRAYSKRFLEKLDLEKGANDYLYSFEIICLAAWHKVRFGELPVRANYHNAHTSVGYLRAAKNSFEEIWILSLYVLAKLGFKIKMFQYIP